MSNLNLSKTGRVAKNTIFLYVRMVFIMAISLYTTRVVLSVLGALDYGIFDIVAGVVSMLTFVNAAMSTSTQRFYSYSLGENDYGRLRSVFSASMNIFILLSLIIVLLGETVGLWFVNTQLTIPAERINAANWVYQFSLLSCVLSMLSVPYSGAIIAHEYMNTYAFIGIFDCALRLLLVYLLTYVPFDKLSVYGFFFMLSHGIVAAIYAVMARRKFQECRYQIVRDKKLHIELFSFSGWSLWGSLAFVGNNQGGNILLNVFFNPIVNASRAVATQISSAMSSFCNSFFMAVRPPIIKAYAEGNYEYMMKLFYLGNKYTYYSLIIICLPCMFSIDYILKLWLTEVTPMMASFTILSMIYSIILALQNPITIIIQASGNVRNYFLIVESVTLLSLPCAYILLKLGLGAEYSYYSMIIIFIIAHCIRLYMLGKQETYFSILEYLKKFILPATTVTILSIIAIYFISQYINYSSFPSFLAFFTVSAIVVMLFTCCVGLTRNERNAFFKLIINKIK